MHKRQSHERHSSQRGHTWPANVQASRHAAPTHAHTGNPVDSIGNLENLQKGDLLFFGRKATDSTAEKVVHVGMWIGHDEFIHSSGKVRISSMDRNSKNYDEYNLNRYLRTKRVFKKQGKGLVDLTQLPMLRD